MFFWMILKLWFDFFFVICLKGNVCFFMLYILFLLLVLGVIWEFYKFRMVMFYNVFFVINNNLFLFCIFCYC